MIASPSDVDQERHCVRDVIHEWNTINAESRKTLLLPVGWDTNAAPAMGAHPQDIINERVLKGCDLLVAVFWTRIGSPTGKAISGTVEEIQEHIKAGKPAMLYFSKALVQPDKLDSAQYELLQNFNKMCLKNGLIEEYSSLSEFKTKFTRQLAQTILQEPYFQLRNNSSKADTEEENIQTSDEDLLITKLSPEATTLLIEASKDRLGNIMKIPFLSGVLIQANGKQFVETGNPRSRAVWEGAIDKLCELGLFKPKGAKGEVFGITAEGYHIADAIIKQIS
jgi:hypothetical protein